MRTNLPSNLAAAMDANSTFEVTRRLEVSRYRGTEHPREMIQLDPMNITHEMIQACDRLQSNPCLFAAPANLVAVVAESNRGV